MRVRERPPLRVSVDVETPSGRHHRWAPDELRPENIPSGLRWSSTMPGGYESLDTTLPRQPGVDYRDLDRLSTIRVRDASGGNVGEYRLERAPRVSGDRMAISPSAVGWQANLEDDKSAREIYVDVDLSRWRGPSTKRLEQLLGTNIKEFPFEAKSDPTHGRPLLACTITDGAWVAPVKPDSEAWYDAQGIPLGGLYVEAHNLSAGTIVDTDALWAVIASLASDDGVLTTTGPSGDHDDTADLKSGAGSYPTTAFLQPTASDRRFARLRLRYNATPSGADSNPGYAFGFSNVAVFGAHGLPRRGSGPGGVYASDVVTHAVSRWAPVLRVTAESITPSSFVIPHLAFLDPTTAAEIVRGATRYGLQDWAVWDDKTFWWHPRGEHARNWRARVGPAGLEETGPQADRLWESVIVAYQDVDGSTRTVGPPGSGANVESADLKDSDPDNPANQLGIIRRDLLQMGVANAASATEVGRRFLEESRQLDTSGRARIVGHVEDDHGVLFPYHAMRAGDTMTFTDASDPSPRRIVRADNSADERACSIDLDAPPEGLQALLERLGVVLVPLGL